MVFKHTDYSFYKDSLRYFEIILGTIFIKKETEDAIQFDIIIQQLVYIFYIYKFHKIIFRYYVVWSFPNMLDKELIKFPFY